MNVVTPSLRELSSPRNVIASGENVAVRPDERMNSAPHPGPLPQLIAMRDVIAWWERENWIARGVR